MAISQNDTHVTDNNLNMKQLKSHVRHDDPEIMSISHIHVPLLSSAISLIVSLMLPRWSLVLVLKLPNTTNSHYLTYTFPFRRFGECTI